jgi:hypothetical protein
LIVPKYIRSWTNPFQRAGYAVRKFANEMSRDVACAIGTDGFE